MLPDVVGEAPNKKSPTVKLSRPGEGGIFLPHFPVRFVKAHQMNQSSNANSDAALPSPDLSIFIDDSIALFRPLTDKARQWLEAHCPPGPDHQYFGGALVVEARYVGGLLVHAQQDGLEM